MNLVVIGYLIDHNLMEIKGIGYGFKSNVYCCQETFNKLTQTIPIVLIA